MEFLNSREGHLKADPRACLKGRGDVLGCDSGKWAMIHDAGGELTSLPERGKGKNQDGEFGSRCRGELCLGWVARLRSSVCFFFCFPLQLAGDLVEVNLLWHEHVECWLTKVAGCLSRSPVLGIHRVRSLKSFLI